MLRRILRHCPLNRKTDILHKRALSSSVLELLPDEGQVLDLTCGAGLDASELLSNTNCKLLAVDWDTSIMPLTIHRYSFLQVGSNAYFSSFSVSNLSLVKKESMASPVK